MKCEHAEQGRGSGPIKCKLLTERGDGRNLCGNQRYCDKQRKCVLTDFAAQCPLKNPIQKTEAKAKKRKAGK